jgi:hypothetical protein
MSPRVEGVDQQPFALLLGIISHGFPPQWLVLETIPRHELSDHPLEELFQFSNYYESSEPVDRLLGKLFQLPMDTVDTRRADAVIDPSLDQVLTNQSSFYGQDAIESVQSTLGHCASKD